MPKLYLQEYRKTLAGRTVLIACREGIVRDHFAEIVADIKFLNRQDIHTAFLHNISNRFANRKHFIELQQRLRQTRIVRVPAQQDFYRWVLDFQDRMFKLIFLERKFMLDNQGHRINTLTTQLARERFGSYADAIANTNFKAVIEQICSRIENGTIERVHILPAGSNSIKHELFTVEGSGTLIANNFSEAFESVHGDEDVRMVNNILRLHLRQGFLKPRPQAYIKAHRERYYVAKIDGIIVGCVEKRMLAADTVELGSLAISTKFRNQRVGVYLIKAFSAEMRRQGYRRLASLTNNPRLAELYLSLGFEQQSPPDLSQRQARSPQVTMFVKRLSAAA